MNDPKDTGEKKWPEVTAVARWTYRLKRDAGPDA